MTATWSEGYNADIAYTHGVYRELAPDYLAYVCLLNAVRPPRTDRPFRYCELGCGQGMTLNILAATHPHATFVGVDFNPVHTAGARRLAEEAGLANAIFREQSFQEMAAEAAAEEDGFDFIVLHGVYSWIGRENRQAIVDILARRLKPGGIAYVSYNSLPGWAPLVPLQKMMMIHADAQSGRSDHRLGAALAFLDRLQSAGAAYFTANAAAGRHLDQIRPQNSHYLVHEYLNSFWEPLAHADVARDMERAKLVYACSATIPLNIDELSLSPEIRALVAEAADPVLAETVRDFALNQVFRRDVFVRGIERLPVAAAAEELSRRRFTLAVPRDKAGLSVPIPLGGLAHAPDLGLPILEALADGTPSLGEIVARPDLARHDFGTIARFLAMQVWVQNAQPVTAAPETGRDGGDRLNRALAHRMRFDTGLLALASPVTGMGLMLDDLERLALAALLMGHPSDPESLAGSVSDGLARAGRSVLAEDGTTVTDPLAARARIAVVLAELLPKMLPVWRRLGILPA